jgi:endonuclease G
VPIPAKVTVLTGPVLDADDPFCRALLADGSKFQMPILFWKVVYYVNEDSELFYAGFLMGQLNPLRRLYYLMIGLL